MTPPSRFKHIARDLEKLPCELHEDILGELEFEQLVRLSQSAGPRLLWSLENSLSPWGTLFKNGSLVTLQRLLTMTDQLRRLCFQLPAKKGGRPWIFEAGVLSFLQRRKSDWMDLRSYESLFDLWLSSLNWLAIDTTWGAFHQEYSKLVKPWIATMDGAAGAFEKVPHVGEPVTDNDHLEHATDTAFSIDELANFISTYQRLRLVRAEKLAAELRQLADIYEANPTLLKTPFAPQTPRPNLKHVPSNLRFHARKVLRRAKYGRWGDKDTVKYCFRFPFPALIPYDWTTIVFNKLWQGNTAVIPREILDKYRVVLEEAPLWVTGMPAHEQDKLKDLSNMFEHVALSTGPPLCKPTVVEVGDAYFPHPEQVKWLATFAEVVAWMGANFPGDVRSVRGDGLVTGG